LAIPPAAFLFRNENAPEVFHLALVKVRDGSATTRLRKALFRRELAFVETAIGFNLYDLVPVAGHAT